MNSRIHLALVLTIWILTTSVVVVFSLAMAFACCLTTLVRNSLNAAFTYGGTMWSAICAVCQRSVSSPDFVVVDSSTAPARSGFLPANSAAMSEPTLWPTATSGLVSGRLPNQS